MGRPAALGAAWLVLAVALSGCAGPASNGGTDAPPEPRLMGAAAAYSLALPAMRAVDPSARLVSAEPQPQGFPLVANGGLAPEWSFVFQTGVDPRDLEPSPTYSSVLVNATTERAAAALEPPPGFRVASRLPVGRAWVPDAWTDSVDVARRLALAGVADPVRLELAPDGCDAPRAAAAWLVRETREQGTRTLAFAAASGGACRDGVEPADSLPLALSVSPGELDASRGGNASALVRAATTEPSVAPVALGATAIAGLDGALPWGVSVAFDPPRVGASSAAAGEAGVVVRANASAEPGLYSVYVYGRGEDGRATAGFTGLLVRVR